MGAGRGRDYVNSYDVDEGMVYTGFTRLRQTMALIWTIGTTTC